MDWVEAKRNLEENLRAELVSVEISAAATPLIDMEEARVGIAQFGRKGRQIPDSDDGKSTALIATTKPHSDKPVVVIRSLVAAAGGERVPRLGKCKEQESGDRVSPSFSLLVCLTVFRNP